MRTMGVYSLRSARRASVRVRAGRVARRRAATVGCVRGRAGRNAVRGLVSRRGLRTIDVRLRRRVHRARFRGSRAISYRGRHAAVIMTCARLTRGTIRATTWASTRSLRRHERRPSYTLHARRRAGLGAAGRHPWGGGESRPVGQRVFYVSSTASYAAPTGRVPCLRGAFIIASTPYSCVGFGDQHRGIVVLSSV